MQKSIIMFKILSKLIENTERSISAKQVIHRSYWIKAVIESLKFKDIMDLIKVLFIYFILISLLNLNQQTPPNYWQSTAAENNFYKIISNNKRNCIKSIWIWSNRLKNLNVLIFIYLHTFIRYWTTFFQVKYTDTKLKK